MSLGSNAVEAARAEVLRLRALGAELQSGFFFKKVGPQLGVGRGECIPPELQEGWERPIFLVTFWPTTKWVPMPMGGGGSACLRALQNPPPPPGVHQVHSGEEV